MSKDNYNRARDKKNQQNRMIALENTKRILAEKMNMFLSIDEIDRINILYSPSHIFKFLIEQIKIVYHVDLSYINFEDYYKTLNSYTNMTKIVYDKTFYQAICDFYLLILDWAKDDANQNYHYENLYKIIIGIIENERVLTQEDTSKIILQESFTENMLYYCEHLCICIEFFIILHELGHVFYNHKMISSLKNECQADMFAFEMLKVLIERQKNGLIKEYDCFEDFILISPVIFFEMFETINIVCKSEFKQLFFQNQNEISLRKENLFNQIKKYDFNDNVAECYYNNCTYYIDQFNEIYFAKYITHHFIYEEKKEQEPIGLSLIILKNKDDNIKGISIHPRNMVFNLKETLFWVIETTLLSTLSGINNRIIQFLYLYSEIVYHSIIELSDLAGIVVYVLSINDIYEDNLEQGLNYDELKNKIINFTKHEISDIELKNTLNQLGKMKIIVKYSDKLYLSEYVFYKS